MDVSLFSLRFAVEVAKQELQSMAEGRYGMASRTAAASESSKSWLEMAGDGCLNGWSGAFGHRVRAHQEPDSLRTQGFHSVMRVFFSFVGY